MTSAKPPALPRVRVGAEGWTRQGIMAELITNTTEREMRLEREKLLSVNPHALRRDLQAASQMRADKAVKDLCRILPGCVLFCVPC